MTKTTEGTKKVSLETILAKLERLEEGIEIIRTNCVISKSKIENIDLYSGVTEGRIQRMAANYLEIRNNISDIKKALKVE